MEISIKDKKFNVSQDSNKIKTNLLQYRNKEKFSEEEWTKRWLNPSDPETCELMENLINTTIDELLLASGIKNQKRIISKNLKKGRKIQFDTEEREFIADCYYEIGSICDIDLSRQLNQFIYGKITGSILSFLDKIR